MAVQDHQPRLALVTGITGQDGAYLAEHLLALGYIVHGIKRRSSSFNTARVDHLYQDPHTGSVPFLMRYGDMTDSTNLIRLVQQIRPTEIYDLAAQSRVGVSFEWRGKGVDETGIDRASGKTLIRVDPTYFRPTEVDLLIGDASKAPERFGWTPRKRFADLFREVVAADLQIARREIADSKHHS